MNSVHFNVSDPDPRSKGGGPLGPEGNKMQIAN